MDKDTTSTRRQEYADMAACALSIQDACNLSGLVYAFAKVVEVVSAYANEHGKSTEWKNKHPLAQLWVDKLGHLAGTQSFSWEASRAYKWAEAQAAAGHAATLEYGWAS